MGEKIERVGRTAERLSLESGAVGSGKFPIYLKSLRGYNKQPSQLSNMLTGSVEGESGKGPEMQLKVGDDANERIDEVAIFEDDHAGSLWKS